MSRQEYFDEVFHLAGKAAREQHEFQFGAVSLSVRTSGGRLDELLTRAVRHTAATGKGAIEVRCFEGSAMPAPPWTTGDYLARGAIAGWNTGPIRVQYLMDHHNLQLVDTVNRRAVYWAQRAEFIPWWEQTFPYRQFLHWLLAGEDYQPIHAGAVGFENGGVLIVGKSGSGKSTSCLSCLDSPLLYGGDDYVLADLTGPEPWVRSLYGTAKVEPDNVHRLPWLAPWITNSDALAEQKAVVYVNEQAPERMSKGFPLRAILLPRVTGLTDTRLRPARAFEAMQAIAPTTIFHLIDDAPAAMAKISRLTRAVPAYWLEAGTDLQQIPQVIGGLL